MLNIAPILTYGVCEYLDKTAVVFQGSRISYRELHERSNQIANSLKSLGIGLDDKVALSCPNLPDFPMVYFAILKVGAVVVPLNVLLKRDEISYHLNDSVVVRLCLCHDLIQCRYLPRWRKLRKAKWARYFYVGTTL